MIIIESIIVKCERTLLCTTLQDNVSNHYSSTNSSKINANYCSFTFWHDTVHWLADTYFLAINTKVNIQVSKEDCKQINTFADMFNKLRYMATLPKILTTINKNSKMLISIRHQSQSIIILLVVTTTTTSRWGSKHWKVVAKKCHC